MAGPSGAGGVESRDWARSSGTYPVATTRNTGIQGGENLIAKVVVTKFVHDRFFSLSSTTRPRAHHAPRQRFKPIFQKGNVTQNGLPLPRGKNTVRFGIIGCGSIAENSFGPALLASERLELVAVCRRDLQAARDFADRFGGPRAYASAEELVRDEQVQAVIVSTPTDTHRDYTCLAAEHGKHVLCEKPMARNAAECREMLAACKAHGVTLGVAYRRRTCPQVIAAKRLIAAGRIGRVVFVRTHYSGRWDPQPGDWRIEPEIGGALMEMASHRIEVLLNFGGRPRVGERRGRHR